MTDRLVNRAECQELAEELRAAAEQVFLKHGYALDGSKAKYGSFFEWNVKASPVEMGPNGVNLNSPQAQAFTRWAASFGMTPEQLGGTMEMKGETLTFVGVEPKRRKYPLVFRRPDGSEVLYTEGVAKLVKAP